MKTTGFAVELYKHKLEDLELLCREMEETVWYKLTPEQRSHVRDTHRTVSEKLSSI